MRLVVSHFAAPDGGDPILFEGVDNVPEDTGKRREHLFRGTLEYIEWDPEPGQSEAQPVADPGPLGGSVECLLASLAENGQVIRGRADESTAAVALFPDSPSTRPGSCSSPCAATWSADLGPRRVRCAALPTAHRWPT